MKLSDKISFVKVKMFVLCICFCVLNVICAQTCNYSKHLFFNVNKYNPEFDLNSYTTEAIQVNVALKENILKFKLFDFDTKSDDINQFSVQANSSVYDGLQFTISKNQTDNTFQLNFNGKLFYNINNAHRYTIELIAHDNGIPQRTSKAIVNIPLINFNVHAPKFKEPVNIYVAITHDISKSIGILNAYDIDGDRVTYTLIGTNDYVRVEPNGNLILIKSLRDVSDSINLLIQLKDDASCCPQTSSVPLMSTMNVKIVIVEVNSHSPQFIANSHNINYCDGFTTFEVNEGEKFQIEIVATDADPLNSPNSQIEILTPDFDGRVPQNSFELNTLFNQTGKTRKAIVSNKDVFDFERPMYGSNLMYITYFARDKGSIQRKGYCFMSIQILDINDNIPVFTQNAYTIFINDGYKPRQWSYRFVATDADSGRNGEIDYFIEKSSSKTIDLLNLFNLSLNGLLSINNITYFDQLQEISFEIYAQDRSIHRNRSKLVNVNFIKSKLSMLPPYFSDFPAPPEIRDVSEMTLRGTVLRNFSIIMQGDYSSHYLRCFLSPKPSPELFKFEYPNPKPALDRNETCVLSVEDRLNYKQFQSVVIYMVAEVGSQFLPNTARELKTITIFLKEENINAPKFVLSTIDASVVEGDDDLNKTIAVAKAYDLDRDDPFNRVTYKIDPYSNIDNYFAIDTLTGDIKLIRPIKNKKSLNLQVIASDGAPSYYNPAKPNSNSIYISINVIDINDNPPRFTSSNYVFSVDEDARPSEELIIGTLDVADDDAQSFFNFSISDSTFGVKNIFLPSRSIAMGSYKGSVQIYLNNYLDFNLKQKTFNVKVFVSDGKYTTMADVIINVVNKNVHAPEFQLSMYQVTIDEHEIPLNTIAQLQAIDKDGDTDFLYECYSTPYLNKESFDLNSKTGELRLKRGLDRDLPNGQSIYFLPISVSDLNGQQGSLKTFSKVKITLNDINDNAPLPFFISKEQTPLTIKEGQTGNVAFYLVDYDTISNGKPFQFNLLNADATKFNVNKLTCSQCVNENRELWSINALQPLNRDEQKSYEFEFEALDSKGLTQRGLIRLTIGDINNNPHLSATKQVHLTFLEETFPLNTQLGTLYVKDKDDWDLHDKYTRNCKFNPLNVFKIEDYSLRISGPLTFNNFPIENMNIQCNVLDKNPNFNEATAIVQFNVDHVYYKDIIDLSVLRLFGLRSDETVKKIDAIDVSTLDKLKQELNVLFELKENDLVKVVNIQDTNLLENTQSDEIPIFNSTRLYATDVYFYIRKNSKYISSYQIDYILSSKLNNIKNKLSITNIELLNDICSTSENTCPANLFCKQSYIPFSSRTTIDANATALVTLGGTIDASCYCSQETMSSKCFNGGNPVSYSTNKYYCECPTGTEGPKCEVLTLTFTPITFSTSHSYAKFKHFKLCEPTRIEFEFTTDRQKGLLLFNGPINREALYFLAVEVNNSNLIVHIGNRFIRIPNKKVDDKSWHYVDISISLNTVQVNLDNCQSESIIIENINELLNDYNEANDNLNLILGGISPEISKQHYYHSYLNVFEYEGCIRNLRVNGHLRNLKLTSNEFNLAQEGCDCKYQLRCDFTTALIVKTSEFPWWIILIIIASLLILAIILGLAVCTIRRKDNQKKILQMFPDDDIRETIINYADGAGEENTENYNIEGMKKRIGGQPIPRPNKTRLDTVDGVETQLNDQLLVFENEGEGSDAGSLSSLNTEFVPVGDLDFSLLEGGGSKFNKLAVLYGYNQQQQPQQTFTESNNDFGRFSNQNNQSYRSFRQDY